MPPGRAPGAAGNCERSMTSMSQSTTIASQWPSRSSARSTATSDSVPSHLAHGHDEITGSNRVFVHLAAVGEAREADLSNVGSPEARPRSVRVPDCRCQTLVCVAHVEMGVESDEADPVEWNAKPKHAGPGHRIVAADKQRQEVTLLRSSGPPRGSARWLVRSKAQRARHRHGRRSWSTARGASRHHSVRSGATSAEGGRAPDRIGPA